ncbi:MAG TPA: HepT-like ribonuclease domain-containing protein [Capsulimonadaceae bacterium]|jgi:uncharacterized protein with HEPN domain
MRRDELYITDIFKAARAISRFIGGMDNAQFLNPAEDLIQSAILQKLTIIGEASARLTDEFKHRAPDIEWRKIIGLRNVAVHAYFTIDWHVVWSAATEDVPALVNTLRSVEPLLEFAYDDTLKRDR